MISKNTKKSLAVFMSLSMVVAGLTTTPTADAATKVKLSSAKGTIAAGKSKTVTIKGVKKSNVKKLTLKSSKSSVVTAKKVSNVKFTVTGSKKLTKQSKATITAKVALKKAVNKKKSYSLKYTATVKAASTPTVSKTVTAFADLEATLASVQKTGGTVTIDSTEAGAFTIAAADYSKVDFVVNAPNADINNSASFKSVTIRAIKAATWVENAAGNKFTITASTPTRFVAASGSNVASLTYTGTGAATVEVVGAIATVAVEAKTDLNISATGTAKVDEVDVKTAGAKVDVAIDTAATVAVVKVEEVATVSVSGTSANPTSVQATEAAKAAVTVTAPNATVTTLVVTNPTASPIASPSASPSASPNASPSASASASPSASADASTAPTTSNAPGGSLGGNDDGSGVASKITYTINFYENTPSEVEVTGTMTPQEDVKVGDNMKTNTYAAEGYSFLGWSTSPGSETADITDNGALTAEVAKGSVSTGVVALYAVWKENKSSTPTDPTDPSDQATTEHTITLRGASNGSYQVTVATASPVSVTSSDTSAKAVKDNEIVIEPTPSTGYEIDKVSYNDGTDHDVNNSSGYKITMPDKDITITVTFKASTYNVTVESVEAEDGSVTINSGASTAVYGSSVGFTVAAGANKKIKSVELLKGEDGAASGLNPNEETNGKYSFTMPAYAVKIKVTFEDETVAGG